MKIPRCPLTLVAALALAIAPSVSRAESVETSSAAVSAEPEPAPVVVHEEKPVAAPKPPPYMLPFQLRGAAVGRSVRFETVFAEFESATGNDPTLAGFFSYSQPITPDLGAFFRMGFANAGTNDGQRGGSITNPAIGAVYLIKLTPAVRLTPMLSVTIPGIAGGGGDKPDKVKKNARVAAVNARSAMDNTILSANDMGFMGGLDVAYVDSGLTLQAEATLNFTVRTRGEMDQPDSTKLNLTSGLFAGYFLQPWISLGTELRFQRWLQPPKAVDTAMNKDALISTLSWAIGPRFHFQLGDKTWFRPAIVYARGLDQPMTTAKYDIVQIDLPIAF
jgi:hypothetical protein